MVEQRLDREARGFRYFSLPEGWTPPLEKILADRWSLRLHDDRSSRILAEAIQRMSDWYAREPEGKTPWEESWCQQAQLVYYLPLNYIRNLAVMKEAQRFSFFEGARNVIDWGSGLGAGSLAARAVFPEIRSLEVERHPVARRLRESIGSFTPEWGDEIRPSEDQAVLCSYSLTEGDSPSLEKAKNLVLIEPSTREDGRRLLELREKLRSQGFYLWAPCTHQEACPLLSNNKDWCHDRIHFDRPPWFLEIESHLPFKNENLTFSYLIASKRKPTPLPKKARLVGDLLREKGKSRQLFCRGNQREFLAKLHRDGELTELSRGIMIEVPEGTSMGSEFRIKTDVIRA